MFLSYYSSGLPSDDGHLIYFREKEIETEIEAWGKGQKETQADLVLSMETGTLTILRC